MPTIAAGAPTTAMTATSSSGIIATGISRQRRLRLNDLSRNSVVTSPGCRGRAGGNSSACGMPRYFAARYRSLLASFTRPAVTPGMIQPSSRLIGVAASNVTDFRYRITR